MMPYYIHKEHCWKHPRYFQAAENKIYQVLDEWDIVARVGNKKEKKQRNARVDNE